MSVERVGLPDEGSGTPEEHGGTAEPGGIPVDVRGATKTFGAKKALDGVDLTVPAGKFCVLLGPSGSGKTTLLRCIAGIERLGGGQVRLGDRLVADGGVHLPPHRRDLAMVFQDYALWPHLTAARNVAFALQRRRLPKAEVAARTARLLERVGLQALGDRYPNELSGGEQQRVALARALVANTGLVLYDEPLSNLDADLRERLRLEIATLSRTSGATSIYITHDQAEAFALADVIGVLQGGRLVQVASPEEVYHRPSTAFVARFTGLAGELPVELDGPAGADQAGIELWSARPATLGAGGSRPILARTPAGSPGGRQAALLVRPSAARLIPPHDADRHVEAVVVDRAYRGRGYDHAVQVGSTKLVGIHDPRPWAPGERVGVRLDPAGCLLFPTLPEVGAPPTAARPVGAAALGERGRMLIEL